MTCSCPKCSAEIELNTAEIPAEGSFIKCAACKASLAISKESFAKRALYKSADISCAECGNPPGTSIYCENCHAIYPEIIVTVTSSAAKKQLGKILASFSLLRNVKVKAKAQRISPSSAAPPGKGKRASLPGKPAQIAALVAVLLVLAVGGGYAWYQNKIATEYTGNYMRAILAIKTSRDYEITMSNRIAANWKAGGISSLSDAEKKATASGKKDVDTLIGRLGKVPEKFTASNEALKKLHASYGKLHDAVTNPVGSSDIYAAAVQTQDGEFMKAVKELKASLPEKISTRLNENKKKYKPLQDF